MSPFVIRDLLIPSAGPAVSEPQSPDLTAEAREALVRRARDVIAGRIAGPPIEVPPEVEKFTADQIKTFPAEANPDGIRALKEWMTLQAIYRGEIGPSMEPGLLMRR